MRNQRRLTCGLGFLAVLCLVCRISIAQHGEKEPAQSTAPPSDARKADDGDKRDKPDKAEKPLEGTVEKASITKDHVTIDSERIHYRATAANMPMKDEAGKLKATVFFIAYEKIEPEAPAGSTKPSEDDTETEDHNAHSDDAKEKPQEPAEDKPAENEPPPTDRPITFVFNGGPGAAAVWLHLGTAGPRRIDLLEDGEAPAPPFRLVENAWSWLDATDMVFIDPVGTGFSRPAEGERGDQFYGVREDIRWVADFIRLYLTQYRRWLSPVFLAGESYGTTRAAGLSEYLLDRYGIALNGIMLISTVLDFQTIRPGAANDLPYWLYLPTYTAAAWYHQRLPDDLQADLPAALREVEQWSATAYTVALARGRSMAPEERRDAVKRLARYTGLPEDLIDRSNLRIDPSVFQKRLLASERKIIGRFDARITGFDPDPTAEWPPYDPSLSRYFAVYSSTFNDYVRRVLKYESVLPYEVLSDRVRPWKFGEEGTGYLSVSSNLRDAMVKNPHLKILVASGYYDLATPYFATTNTINRLDLGPDLLANLDSQFYHGGHMMYHNRPALQQLHADVTAFIRSAAPPAKR